MIETLIFLQVLTALAWLAAFIYIIYMRRVIPINVLGLMLAAASLHPYILYIDIITETLDNIDLKVGTLVCRILVLAVFYSVIKRYKYMNLKFKKISETDKNLLKPNNESSFEELTKTNID